MSQHTFKVLLRLNRTGEERWVEEESYGRDNPSSIAYPLIDGNFSCDCNRYDMFYKHKDNQPFPEDGNCNTGAFTLLRIQHEDGRILGYDGKKIEWMDNPAEEVNDENDRKRWA